MFFKLYSE